MNNRAIFFLIPILSAFSQISISDSKSKFKKPIYFIHADMDHIIPVDEAILMMKESGSEDKDLYIVNGANHYNIIMIMNDSYFQNIKFFIDKK